MRPIKLTMTAFGPYSDKTEIDFTLLGTRGLYLVTGDTGAGKTTIFDAIAFALYGEASGDAREAAMLRSKHANPTVPTEVELVFSYAGKEYTVKRNPEYERPKSKGEGMTVERAGATLIMPDGRVVTKYKDVTREVEAIMGIDRNQFTQIAMIAQGDFQKLLFASTEERKRIFQKIFRTQGYSALQQRLKEEASSLLGEYNRAAASIRQYSGGIDFDAADARADAYLAAKNSEIPTAELLEIISELLIKDRREDAALVNERTAVSEELEKVTAALAELKAQGEARENLLKLRGEVALASDELTALNEALILCEKRKKECEGHVEKIAEISAVLPEYAALDTLVREKEELTKKNESNKKKLAAMEAEAKKLDNKIAELKNERSGLDGADKALAELRSDFDKATARANEMREVKDELGELFEQQKKQKLVQSEYLEKVNAAEEMRKKHKAAFRLYLDAQAGILAEGLSENEPCPVCGSREHPALAKRTESAPDKKELDGMESAATKAEIAATAASANAAQINGAVETRRENLIKRLSLHFENAEIDGAEELITKEILDTGERISALESKIRVAEEQIKRKGELDKLIPDDEKKRGALEEEKRLLSDERIASEQKIKSDGERIDALSKKLKFKCAADAERERALLQKEKDESNEEYLRAGEAASKKKSEIDGKRAAISETERILATASAIDGEAVMARQDALKNKDREMEARRLKINSRITANESAEREIKKKADEIIKIESRLAWVKALSDTASGTLGGKEKIMLEAYVQSAYFDKIIARANRRLLMMSGGQYDLVRSRTAENNRSQSGLDLSVIDHFSGTERSVKTLSGGESFKASLSLALGLADEIQSSCGGIRLDTMFVDEGFGSLDDESLEQAMRALSDLVEGERLVGIISHVAGLNERIDKKITVTKDRGGNSKIKIITG